MNKQTAGSCWPKNVWMASYWMWMQKVAVADARFLARKREIIPAKCTVSGQTTLRVHLAHRVQTSKLSWILFIEYWFRFGCPWSRRIWTHLCPIEVDLLDLKLEFTSQFAYLFIPNFRLVICSSWLLKVAFNLSWKKEFLEIKTQRKNIILSLYQNANNCSI